MRILHLVNSLDPGGMENGVCNIAAGLEARGMETHVACLERSGAFSDRVPGTNRIHVLHKAGGFSLRASWNLARLLRKLRPAVLHTHNLGPLIYASVATVGGRTARILHGEHSQLAPWELEPRRIRQRQRLYRACREIHTVSREQVAELGSLGFPESKIFAIPNGVDTARFSPGSQEKAALALDIPGSAPVIGLVGRFGPFKRHDALIAALPAIRTAFRDARLLLVGGGGSEEKRIRELAAGNPGICITGFRSDPESCYRAMDLLVVPSINEGMSNAVLEAMACGIAVLANTGCGHEEIIIPGENGHIAPLANPEDIAHHIIEMLNDWERLSILGENARKTVKNRFSIETMLNAYEQTYRRIAA
ncbi:MAG: hypothetical protein RL088_2243 [Verrucomicrobiota bacterium]|jgi:glycosyltransferase involved in cell wall biosynthesis